MDRDLVMRRALRTSFVFNLFGALGFAFPGSLGSLAGFPSPVPHVYSATLAVLVTLFGCTYAWLAAQPRIDRPIVAFCALGKAGFFTVVLACWLLGELPGMALGAAAGDLVFAAIFFWWLLGDAEAPAVAARAVS
ncbi:MAG TPA: hypothetical protein VKH82_10655 [Candidatus Binatia bacterium]|nr:hypothetical protein [Candidatus Binatia bacterium]